MKRVNNKYIFIFGLILGLVMSITTVYAVDAYIESKKVAYNNHNKTNVEEAIDELYEKSGMHKEKWLDPTLQESGNYPLIVGDLIPVEIKDSGEVYYANENSEWYNYGEKRWANAVILIDNPSNTNYQVGDHIIEDDIESYFVWIPRYSYKIWDIGNYQELLVLSQITDTKDTNYAFWKVASNNSNLIDIKFVNPNISESGKTVGTYLTHPAFTLGNKKLSGLWVGKFETGGNSPETMVVKPDVYSWRNANVKIFFNAAKDYNSTLDSHMLKNTEWGAIAYLSHSIYGIGTEVNVNNASDYKTGYSATLNASQKTYPGITSISTDATLTQPWNTSIGHLASTTGNITGVYDMSGGAWEYLAACMQNTPGDSTFSLEELQAQILAGYIDGYPANSITTSFNYCILGDATGELGPFYKYKEGNDGVYNHNSWYADYAAFVSSGADWFARGGNYPDGVVAGQFHFSSTTGGAKESLGFRIALAPIK